jgi:hypothetical protein
MRMIRLIPSIQVIFLYSILVSSTSVATAQTSTQPTLPVGYKSTQNAVLFANGAYVFRYSPPSGRPIQYEYKIQEGGTLRSLTVFGERPFLPSNSGGVGVSLAGKEILPWNEALSFRLISHSLRGKTVTARWGMRFGGEEIAYTYTFRMQGRTLVIDVETDSSVENATGFYLDRCENAVGAKAVRIPYLTLLSVLYTNNLFTTLYFDWERTNASRLVALDGNYSPTSVRFAQNALYRPRSNGKRNRLRERIYLTVSANLDDVLPNIPNPVSKFRNESASRIVWDYWHRIDATQNLKNDMIRMNSAGVKSLWLLAHDWQPKGYDNEYPAVLLESGENPTDAALRDVYTLAAASGYRFGLHENYADLHENSRDFKPEEAGVDVSGNPVTLFRSSWQTPEYPSGHSVFLLKPSQILKFSNKYSPEIHNRYQTSSSFLDVHSSANPSEFVDYDASQKEAGKFITTLKQYRTLFAQLQKHHKGPVSGEGRHHFLYLGYIDDVEAQINTGSDSIFGYRAPLLVDFDLRKLRPKAIVHGVGYYQRFFAPESYDQLWKRFSRDSVLSYIATELAYGHAGFIPDDRMLVTSVVEHALFEQEYVYPIQKAYADATPTTILYNTSENELVNASEYINRYGATFDNIGSSAFMSQVRIEYSNGVIVCVNRNPHREWEGVTLGKRGGWFSYHAATQERRDPTTYAGMASLTTFVLPKNNGWVCYVPFVP